MRRTVAILGIFWAGIALADMGGSFQQGKDLGSAATGGTFSEINSGAAAGKVPAYGTSPAEAQYYQGGQGQLAGPGIAKMQGCGSYTPGSDPTANQECEAVNFLARNPQVRPQFNITKNDPMILGAQSARNNAETFFQSIGINGGAGSSTQCTTKTETTPAQYTTETCSSVKELETQQCTMGRLIDIDTDANFQCDQTVGAYETVKCRRSSNATCAGGGDGCDQGGIVANSWAGDMATSWFPDGAGNYILQFGTIADNYWGGYGAVYDRSLIFEIRDVALITRFALSRSAFDDWLLVRMNDTTVYVGPYGGDRLEVVPGFRGTERVQYCATCYGNPELSTSWSFDLNIDLKPYLRNGSNTIFMRTIVAGGGEGAIQLTTRQVCTLQCGISTQNSCAALEARSQ